MGGQSQLKDHRIRKNREKKRAGFALFKYKPKRGADEKDSETLLKTGGRFIYGVWLVR